MADKDAKDPKEAKDPKDAPKEGEAAEKAAPEGGKSRAKLFIIAGVVVVLLGGGGAGAYFVMRPSKTADTTGKTKEAAAKKKPAKKPEETGIVSFEPFVVNLADPGGKRFLRINVRLIVDGVEQAEHIQKSEVLLARLRSDILEQLTEQTSEKVSTPDGKTELKKSIAEHAHHIVQPTEIADVLFSDFVVQY